jgi:hypothetical protein
MKSVYRGMAIGILQCVLVLSVAGKYALDRARLPRVWAKAAPVDPSLFIRGRYVSLRLQVECPPDAQQWPTARLSTAGGRLYAIPDPAGTVHIMQVFAGRTDPRGTQWALAEPLAFFIPEDVPDPSRRAPDEELWVEVSVPVKGPPRPVQLAVKKNGVMRPLGL